MPPTIKTVTFGKYNEYVEEINLPQTIRTGEEFISTSKPLVTIKRGISIKSELFQEPYFHIARKVRVRFHWDGLRVLGVNMEEPNCFLFPIPVEENVRHKWFLKLSCLPDCAPGTKSLYVSIEVLRENLILKGLSWFAKVISALSLLLTIAIPVMYYFSKTMRIYVNDVVGFSSTDTISLAAVVVFSIFILSTRLDEVFPTLVSDKNIVPLFTTDKGSKTIIAHSLSITKARDN